jgi:hypothetical protein
MVCDADAGTDTAVLGQVPATLISASPEDSWGLQYLAPYAGLATASRGSAWCWCWMRARRS